MSDIAVVRVRPDDETLILFVEHNGEMIELGSANHDEHGWAGIGILETVSRNLAGYLGNVEIIESDGGEDYDY